MRKALKPFAITDYPSFIKRLDDYSKAYASTTGKVVLAWHHTSKKAIFKLNDGTRELVELDYIMSSEGLEYINQANTPKPVYVGRPIRFRFYSRIDKSTKECTLIGCHWRCDVDPSVYSADLIKGLDGVERTQRMSDGSLQQFTGVDDSNHKEIFEHDYLKFHINGVEHTGVVVYVDGSWMVLDNKTNVIVSREKTLKEFVKFHVARVYGSFDKK